MLTLSRTLVMKRRCPRRPWRGSSAMVVHKGQRVSYYGRTEHGEVGMADCTACGGQHLLLGGLWGLVAPLPQ
jgi:hypothetical protein